MEPARPEGQVMVWATYWQSVGALPKGRAGAEFPDLRVMRDVGRCPWLATPRALAPRNPGARALEVNGSRSWSWRSLISRRSR